MIKFMATGPTGRKVLGIILFKENISFLQKDCPIHFHKEQMGLVELKIDEVVIGYFETEKIAREWIKSNELISLETKIIEDERRQ